eukprot:TRINITY_DN9203_c0_g1_i4.p1 TRINITY_DN9203_c0_g1~~TRINITY_DN9203_c0_g1_i4.p1  ORF type:complete len:111 (+),score=6.34 TRINITY_DN9203_c0_g1_i4:125-457(+)
MFTYRHHLSSSCSLIVIICRHDVHLSSSSVVIMFTYHQSSPVVIMFTYRHLSSSYSLIITCPHHVHLSSSPVVIMFTYHQSCSLIIITCRHRTGQISEQSVKQSFHPQSI